MKLKLLLLLLFLFLSFSLIPNCLATNDFSGDANCAALYRFESGALTTDSKGSNTLTNNNAVAEETGSPLESGCSADLERDSAQYFSITDANLDAGFPLKNGDTNKKISICFLCKPESWGGVARYHLFLKGHGGVLDTTSMYFRRDGSNQIEIGIGYNGGQDWEVWSLSVEFTGGKVYHVAFTYDDSNKTAYCKIYNITDSNELFSYASNVYTNNINIEDAPIEIGADQDGVNNYDGLIDEFVVFKDILSEVEIDEIRTETYGAAAAGTTIRDAIIRDAIIR